VPAKDRKKFVRTSDDGQGFEYSFKKGLDDPPAKKRKANPDYDKLKRRLMR